MHAPYSKDPHMSIPSLPNGNSSESAGTPPVDSDPQSAAADSSAFPGTSQPRTVKVGGIAVAALVMSILAFLAGWIPIVGALFGITGLVLGIIALVRRRGRAFGITAVILSTIAIITSVIMTVIGVMMLPFILMNLNDISSNITDEVMDQVAPPQIIETPCYGFDAPSGYINNQAAADAEACWTTLELWGELDADGDFVNTGEGDLFGSIYIEPVGADIIESWGVGSGSDGGDLDAAVNYLAEVYYSQLGTITSLKTPVMLDGVPANITRFDNGSGPDTTNVAIVSFSPTTYSLEQESSTIEANFWVITVATMEDDGDDIIEQLVETWQWR